MMFYADHVLPSAYPVMMHPRKRQACHPLGCSIPIHVRKNTPEMPPRYHKQRAFDEDFLSYLLGASDNEDDNTSSSDSDDQEVFDFISLFGNQQRSKHKRVKKSTAEKPENAKDNESSKRNDKKEAKSDKKEAKSDKKEAKSDKKEAKSDKEARKTSDSSDEKVISRLDMRGYAPENISVKTNDEKRVVTILAKRVYHTLFGPMTGERSHVVPIPEGIAAHDIRSYLSPEGVLYLKTNAETTVTTEKESDSKSKCNADNKLLRNYSENENMSRSETSNESGPTYNEGDAMETDAGTTDESSNINSKDQSEEDAPTGDAENKKTKKALEKESMETSADDETAADTSTNTGSTSKGTNDERPETEIETKHDVPSDATDTAQKSDSYEVIISQFDMNGFSADDINVSISDDAKMIDISAKHEEKTPNGLLIREYYRAVPIPEGVSPKEIRSHLSPEGQFFLQAPNGILPVTE